MATTIAGEISRLNAAKREIKRSIEAKGVRVDPNARIDIYPQFINRISGVALESLSVTQNGTYTSPSNTAYNEVTVNVSAPAPTVNLQDKTATANGSYTADAGYDGLGTVTVNVTPTLENKTITTNGTYTADQGYDGLGTVTVNVSGGGSQVNAVTVYYIINSSYYYSPSSYWEKYLLYNSNDFTQVIDKMYINGTQVTPSPNFDYPYLGCYKVRYELNSPTANVPNNTFGLNPVAYIDWSEYTGTVMPSSGGGSWGTDVIPSGIETMYGNPSHFWGNEKCIIPNTVITNNESFFGRRAFFEENSTWYSKDFGAAVYNSSDDRLVIVTNNNVHLPYGLTSFDPSQRYGETTGLVFPTTLTHFGGFDYQTRSYWFLNPTPPVIGPNADDYGDSDCVTVVPHGAESDYLNAFRTANLANASTHVAPYDEIEARIEYDSNVEEDTMFYRFSADGWRIGQIDVYDTNHNIVHTVEGLPRDDIYGNARHVFTSGDGDYIIKSIFCNYERWQDDGVVNNMFLECNITYAEVKMNNKKIGVNWFNNCQNLRSIKVSGDIDGIRDGFCNGCTSLSEITFDAATPPSINPSECFNNLSNSVTVYLPDNTALAAYSADANWASLQQQGKISMTV